MKMDVSEEYFRFDSGYLFCERLKVKEIVERIQEHTTAPVTPLFVYSKNQIIQNIKGYLTSMSKFKRDYRLNYAIKANMNPSIIGLMKEHGCSATLVSGFELQLALRLGFEPGYLMLNGNGKQIWEIELAVNNGCLLNIDSMFNLEQTIRVCKQQDKVARVLLRVNPDIDASVHRYISTGKRGAKFGIEEDQLDAVAMVIKENPLIKLVGLHCHLGSTITSISVFRRSARVMLHLLTTLRERGFSELRYLNLGGGLGIDYTRYAAQTTKHPESTNNKQSIPTPSEIIEAIEEELTATDVSVILEPGRSLVGNAVVLATRAIGVKMCQPYSYIVVDAAMTEVLRAALYSAYHHIQLVEPSTAQSDEQTVYDVVGPVCESADFLGKDRYLARPHEGCLLAVFDVGAYCASMGSNYNMRPRPAEAMVDGEKMEIIRKADTLDDLLRPFTHDLPIS